MRTVYRVEYVAGPQNLELALNDLTRAGWVRLQLLPHPTAEPRYTLIGSKIIEADRQEEASFGVE